MGPSAIEEIEAQKMDEVHKRAATAGALFHSVRARMRGKSSAEFPSVLESVLHRKLTREELAELGCRPNADPEDLIKQLWYALVFEAYFAGHPRVTIPVHLLPGPEKPDYCLWSDDTQPSKHKKPVHH